MDEEKENEAYDDDYEEEEEDEEKEKEEEKKEEEGEDNFSRGDHFVKEDRPRQTSATVCGRFLHYRVRIGNEVRFEENEEEEEEEDEDGGGRG